MRMGSSGATVDGLRERETSCTGGRRKRHRGGDEQGRPDAYKWAPPGAAREGGSCGWATRKGEVWLGHKERGRDFPFFIFLFSTKFHPKILFAKSLNHKQTKHGPA
jgi:hypothetical protein